jgi:hypothetical protein
MICNILTDIYITHLNLYLDWDDFQYSKYAQIIFANYYQNQFTTKQNLL